MPDFVVSLRRLLFSSSSRNTVESWASAVQLSDSANVVREHRVRYIDGGKPRFWSEQSTVYRVGIGHDTHRLGDGGPLVLGGLSLEHDRHAIGHSDADVLLHAVTDAVLGAASLGDIGELFPDTDPANRGKDSAEMLAEAVRRMQQAGFAIVNLDCIVFAQRPKLSPYKDAIRDRLASVLGVSSDVVGVKAKTGESVGPIGREEAISAQCVVLLCSKES